MPEEKEKKYTIRSLTSRGMKKKDDGRGSRAMNVELNYPQYCKLRLHSIETGIPMKYLLLQAYTEKWGSASDIDVQRYEGAVGLPPIEPKSTASLQQGEEAKTGLSDTPNAKNSTSGIIANPIAAKLFLRHRVKDQE